MDFADFMGLIDAKYIYEGGKNMAQGIFITITPMLLVVAIWLRLGSNQLASATSGQAKWGEFFRDLAIWVTILGLYFTLASFVTELFNVLYSYFQERGSLGVILSKFAELITKIDEAGENSGILSQGISILGSPVTFVVWLFYYFSFILATILLKFLKLAHAICWSFSLVWGLIAIPMSLTSNFKLLKGWGIFTGITLLWPIIHFGGFALFNPIFENAANEFVFGSGAGIVSLDKAQLYLIMTVVNILAITIAMSAPFIAMSLISNSGSIAGVVAPFATAAVAAAGAATVQAKAASGSATSLGGRAGAAIGQDMLNGRNPLSRVSQGFESLKQGIMGPSASTTSAASKHSGPLGGGFIPTSNNSVSTPKTSGESSSGSSVQSTMAKAATLASSASVGPMDNIDSSGTDASTSSTMSEQLPSSELPENERPKAHSKKQQRRGAIINNLSKPTKGSK